MSKQVKLIIGSTDYREEDIVSLSTHRALFDREPSIGNCVSGTLETVLYVDSADIPRNAQLTPRVGTEVEQREIVYRYNWDWEVTSGVEGLNYVTIGNYGDWEFTLPSDLTGLFQWFTWLHIIVNGNKMVSGELIYGASPQDEYARIFSLSKGSNGTQFFPTVTPTVYSDEIIGTVVNWQQKSQFYVFSREIDHATGALHITAYDAIYRAEQDYYTRSGEQGNWPKTALACMQEIASRTSATICSDSLALLTNTPYYIQYPGYGDGALTMRQVAGDIAKRYAGNWIIDNNGEWRLIRLNDMPPSTHYLITEHGNPITFAGVRILV